MAEIIAKQGWTLHYTIGAIVCGPIRAGDQVERLNGESMIVIDGTPPQEPGSTGRVLLDYGIGTNLEFQPSVIGAQWVKDSE